ncbi:bacterio-opsin activator domain-containing protein [Natronococcus sp. A-GB1]|uniref:bacterio-opsin activator domain-containing protein n=1 Tax=Natronococcus sp. A-GB1 TaxID=3037648 RepID=UPI00241E1A43|nr:bacterio-opsin activator domain-containing protein [Natronococcus sp. A-GB1]MDG5757920.1 bacterio-opsin activator domain-containing protein [Natronococcus sp. A-GB1]
MAPHTSPQSSRPVRLLYVDPDREAAATMASALEASGPIDVTMATGAGDALERLTDGGFDCLVTDTDLPGRDGVDLLEAVRERRSDLPVVLLVRTADDATVDRARTAGATDVLRKEDATRGRWLASRIASLVDERDLGIAPGGDSTDEGSLPAAGGSCLFDDRLRVIEVSELFANLYGYEPDALLGEPWTVLFPADRGPQTAETVRATIDRRGSTIDDALGVRTDGRAIPVQRSVTATDSETYLCSVLDLSGTDRGSVPIERDARRQRALAALSRELREESDSAAFFGSVATAVADAVGADYCGLFESHPDAVVLRAGTGWRDGVDRLVGRPTTQPHPSRKARAGDSVAFFDWEADDRSALSSLLREHGIEDGFEVPVGTIADRPWGFLGVYTAVRRDFSAAEIAFVRGVTSLLGARTERDRTDAAWEIVVALQTEARRGESSLDIARRTVDALAEIPGVSAATGYLYDECEDALERSARAGTFTEADGQPASTLEGGPAWRAFVDRERTLVREVAPEPGGAVSEPGLGRGVVLPLGEHGVLVAAVDGVNELLEPLATATSIARAALERREGERLLAAREETIGAQAKRLERFGASVALERRIDGAVATAASRAELEAAACDRLVDHERIAFAWVGAYDAVGETIEPRAWAGAERSYLNSVSIDTTAPPDEQEPTGATVRTGKPQCRERLLAGDRPERWRREAARRGYRSALSVPIGYAELRYGGLTVYADRHDAFGAEERRALEAIGERLGHAIHALEVARSLLETTDVVELEFQLRDADLAFVRWAAEADARLELESVVARSDGSIRGLFTAEGTSVERVLELAGRAPEVTETSFVTERDDTRLFACLFTRDSIVSRLLEYGAAVRSMESDPDGSTVVAELPGDADVRRVVDAISASFPGAKLARRRHEDRRSRTRFEFLAEVERRLTDRQYEVLRTAYASGYYETPRESSGAEVAALLDIAQPTFNHHLHAAQRKLLTVLFADD